MKFNSKSILATVIVIVAIALLLLVLLVTEKLLSIWQYLQEAPLWVSFIYGTVIMLVAFFIIYLYLILIKTKPPVKQKLKAIDESSLRDSISQLAHRGVDISEATNELQELDKRRNQENFYIALYGTVSSGKK